MNMTTIPSPTRMQSNAGGVMMVPLSTLASFQHIQNASLVVDCATQALGLHIPLTPAHGGCSMIPGLNYVNLNMSATTMPAATTAVPIAHNQNAKGEYPSRRPCAAHEADTVNRERQSVSLPRTHQMHHSPPPVGCGVKDSVKAERVPKAEKKAVKSEKVRKATESANQKTGRRLFPVRHTRAIRGTDKETIWCTTKSRKPLEGPPVEILKPKVGNLYIHKHNEGVQIWMYAPLPWGGGEGKKVERGWTPVRPGISHPLESLEDRVLLLRADGSPTWVLESSARNHKNKARKEARRNM